MKVILLGLLLFVGVAFGQETITFTNQVATFTNLQGRVFRDVVLVRATKQGIVYRIPDTAGGGLVSYTNLSPEFLESLGVPTNRIAAVPQALPKQPVPPQIKSGPPARVRDSLKEYIPEIETIAESDFPNAEALPACKEILSELKGIQKVLEIGTTYDKFCDLIQEKALSVEKIKEMRGDGIPWRFASHADWCLKKYARSRDDWHEKIKAAYESTKALNDFFMRREWAGAGLELLYCAAIVEGTTNTTKAIEHVASMIKTEQDAVKEGVLPPTDLDIAVYGKGVEEIAERLREAIATKEKEATAALERKAGSSPRACSH